MAFLRLFILLLFFIIEQNEVTSHLERSSLWTWSCHKQEKCKREPINGSTNGYSLSNNFNSLDVCRLTCGTYGALWPKPNGYVNLSSQVTPIHFSKIYFEYADTTSETQLYLKDVSEIFVQNLMDECNDNCNIIPDNNVTVYISTISPDLVLSLTTDESYNLEVTTKANRMKVQISAHTVFSARHALETLSQLVASHQTETSSAESKGLVMVSEAKITDRPVYPYRGLLLDTARNFMPIETIKRQLDAMGASKLNTLHWHVTDAQSFPLESPRVPQMTQYGAYAADQIYTPSQITDLLSYALRRGIRIIIELDAPSHSGNGWQWGPTVGLGDLALCVNHVPWRGFCIQPPCGQLNPANNHVYKVLADLYRDILDLVPQNEIIHMGGDEVYINCWNSSDEIVNYLRSQGKGRDTADFVWLWGEFQSKALQNLDEQAGHNNTPVMVWTSSSGLTEPNVIEKYLDKNRYIIETWVPSSDMLPHDLLKLGYRLVISTKDAWYLDHGFWGSTQYYPWRKVYKNKLPNDEKVLGGEVCMWSEYVDNEGVDSKVWPRAAAAAERLWSNPTTEPDAAEARMYRHRERLVQRGISAEALAPEWCFQNEGECL